MKIGIIGSGRIGATTARLFAGAGHEVTIANSRGPESLGELVGELGPQRAGGNRRGRGARRGDRPGGRSAAGVPDLPAEAFAGKVVIDANNYYPQRDGQIAELDSGETTSSELLARHLNGARDREGLQHDELPAARERGPAERAAAERLAIYLAGDDDGRRKSWRG